MITDNTLTDADRPYKVYTALLSQSGTSAPIATVLENTLGGTVVWTMVTNGEYNGTLAGAFPATKTWLTCNINETADSWFSTSIGAFIRRFSNDVIQVQSGNEGSGGVDDELLKTSIEVRVYP